MNNNNKKKSEFVQCFLYEIFKSALKYKMKIQLLRTM